MRVKDKAIEDVLVSFAVDDDRSISSISANGNGINLRNLPPFYKYLIKYLFPYSSVHFS
jgi:hypothetical protein